MRWMAATVAGLAVLAAAYVFLIPKENVTNGVGSDGTAGSQSSRGAVGTESTLASYANPRTCMACHQEIWKSYQQTGMGRSFYQATKATMAGQTTGEGAAYYHRASDRHYAMLERDGKFFQRRFQKTANGEIQNLVEKEIHWVMGSGNHARTYLHQTSQGTLVELPLGWYAEKGGSWAMNPGYDRPDHEDFRREIGYDCMFCHNAYPQLQAGADAYGARPVFPTQLPEGIDCQRCHGPGQAHVDAASRKGAEAAQVQAAIVNPGKLSMERQMEVCMQCHLESNSKPLPYTVQRFGRGTFSYRPGEALADYALHFDHARGAEEREEGGFEIAHAAYRLRKSACFVQSGEAMTCLTCHDPHHARRGKEATAHYTQACLSCHAEGLQVSVAAKQHPADQDCQRCHMPKRRTDDAIHVVMTDHFIRRKPPTRDLTAPIAENHEPVPQGEVALYYPPQLPAGADRDLYLAVAQVAEGVNLRPGIERLERAIAQHKPKQAEFYYELAQAYRNAGEFPRAIALYEEALQKKAGWTPALINLGLALAQHGDLARSAERLQEASNGPSPNAAVLAELSAVQLQRERPQDAEEAARRAVSLDRESPAAQNALGMALAAQGRYTEAAAAYREALRAEPRLRDAHYNLANLLAMEQRFDDAIRHYRKVLETNSRDVEALYNLGAVLGMRGQLAEAKRSFQQVLAAEPSHAKAHLNLGNLERMAGNAAAARSHWQKALASEDPAIRQAAEAALSQ